MGKEEALNRGNNTRVAPREASIEFVVFPRWPPVPVLDGWPRG